jgi:hypothetical protein
MDKYIYLINGHDAESYPAFSARALKMAETLLENSQVEQLKVVYTVEPPPRFSVIPFKKSKTAVISAFLPPGANGIRLDDEPGFAGAYLVEEAIPVAYEKDWEDGRETPGVCLLTLFRKRTGIDHGTFIDRWHNSHTPLSLEIHPLWNYNRNVVTRRLGDRAEPWDGIVEEHFRTASDLLNPIKFFGHPLIMVYNMLRVYADTRSFLDYRTIRPFLAAEIILKTGSGGR